MYYSCSRSASEYDSGATEKHTLYKRSTLFFVCVRTLIGTDATATWTLFTLVTPPRKRVSPNVYILNLHVINRNPVRKVRSPSFISGNLERDDNRLYPGMAQNFPDQCGMRNGYMHMTFLLLLGQTGACVLRMRSHDSRNLLFRISGWLHDHYTTCGEETGS